MLFIGRYEDAGIQYEECLRLQPNHTITIGNLARLLRRLGQTSRAEHLFLRLVKFLSLWLAIMEMPLVEFQNSFFSLKGYQV